MQLITILHKSSSLFLKKMVSIAGINAGIEVSKYQVKNDLILLLQRTEVLNVLNLSQMGIQNMVVLLQQPYLTHMMQYTYHIKY